MVRRCAFLVVLSAVLGWPVAGRADPTAVLERQGTLVKGATAPGLGGWSLDGKRVLGWDALMKGGDGKPGRPLVVSFFSTTCKPCREGLVRLHRLAADHRDGFQVVLVAAGDEAGAAAGYLAGLGVEVLAMADPYQAIAQRWGVAVREGGGLTAQLPRTFVVGPDRVIRRILGAEGPDFEAVIVGAAGAAPVGESKGGSR